MKKHLTSVFACLSIILFSIPACKKDNTPDTPPTNTEIISSSPWLFLKATASGTDISSYPQLACFKDNTVTFALNNTYTVNEGATVCSPSTAGTFAWSFQNNESTLVLASPLIPGGSGTFTIVSLTASNLVVSQDVNFPPLTTIVVTFKH